MPDVNLVRESLATLRCPGYADSVLIGAFEQLTGAAYGLLCAERHGFSRRDTHRYEYHSHVRERIASSLAEHAIGAEGSDGDAFETWVSAFYFNSATDRLVWAAERLIITLACVECPCGPPSALAPRTGFAEIWKRARQRIDHLGTEHLQDLVHFHVLLQQFEPRKFTGRGMPFDPDAVFTMLHHENRRKHSVEPAAEDRTRGDGTRPGWANASPQLMMQTACAAFALACRAYNEIVECHAPVREAEVVTLGELA